VFFEVFEVFVFVQLTEFFQTLFDVSLNQKTKGSLSSMLLQKQIEKEPQPEGDKELLGYRITEKGKEVLCLEFPFFRFLKEEWDGLWRIISYEIPESKREIRDRLRREMRGWGLGPWHRSFWLTPHPIISTLKDLVYGKEEEAYIQAFEATHVFGDREILVEKVWAKDDLDKRYRELFKKWHTVLSTTESNEIKLQHILYEYIAILRDDPGLPASLVGRKWIAFEAFDIFKEVKTILLK
jgi:phenylacetic acid degradation operon negative regulatory protein